MAIVMKKWSGSQGLGVSILETSVCCTSGLDHNTKSEGKMTRSRPIRSRRNVPPSSRLPSFRGKLGKGSQQSPDDEPAAGLPKKRVRLNNDSNEKQDDGSGDNPDQSMDEACFRDDSDQPIVDEGTGLESGDDANSGFVCTTYDPESSMTLTKS
jgi:hypothetical protein